MCEADRRWERRKDVFHGALEAPEGERAGYLARACADDPELLKEVEALLAADARAGGFLAGPAFVRRPETGGGRGANGAGDGAARRVGRYRLLREVGRGGMGEVYLAVRDDEEGPEGRRQKLAVKLIKRGMDTDFVLGRFRRERQVLSRLAHPDIARLLDWGASEDGRPYFVMEYVEGTPVCDYADARRLTVEERLKLFRRVCAAVAHAHRSLVVHRDLKPSNILVTAEGAPRLLDFGIAKLLSPEEGEDALEATAAHLRLMTPEYASPEQVTGGVITTASDVYSLGVLLYELLTGHLPYRFKTRSPEDVAQVVCAREPERPSTALLRTEVLKTCGGDPVTLTPESVSRARGAEPGHLRRRLSGDLDMIVLKALRKEPERRYSSAEQLAEDVRRHLEGLPVVARPDTVGCRTGKFIRRHRAGVAAAAALSVAVVAGVAATAWQARVAGAERARAERRFNDVRRLANSFMFEFDEALTKARRRPASCSFAARSNTSGALRRGRAIDRELADAEPASSYFKRVLSSHHNHIPETLRLAGDFAGGGGGTHASRVGRAALRGATAGALVRSPREPRPES